MRKIRELISEIEKAIVGKETVIETVLMAILAQGHVLLEDIPGVEKQPWRWPSAGRWGWSTKESSLPQTYFLRMWWGIPSMKKSREHSFTSRGQ